MEDALEHFDQLNNAHFQTGFFKQFAHDANLNGFIELEHSSGDGPLSDERFTAASNEQSPAIVDHHTPDTHYRPIGIFAAYSTFWAASHRTSPGVCLMDRRQLILRRPVYNTPSRNAIATKHVRRCSWKVWKEVVAVVRCPECATEIDVDEDEVEEGEIVNCPECEVELEVVQVHPVHLNLISDELDDEDDEEEEEEDDEEEEDVKEDSEELEEEETEE